METILVPESRIAGKVVALVHVQVRFEVTLVVAETRTGHSWPRLTDRQDTLDVAVLIWFRDGVTTDGVEYRRIDTPATPATASRLHRRYAWEIRYNVTLKYEKKKIMSVRVREKASDQTLILLIQLSSITCLLTPVSVCQ